MNIRHVRTELKGYILKSFSGKYSSKIRIICGQCNVFFMPAEFLLIYRVRTLYINKNLFYIYFTSMPFSLYMYDNF